jgi:hypothetical protein
MVGDGIADPPKVIANLRSIGYHGPLSLELFNRDLWECDPETVAKRGLERVRSWWRPDTLNTSPGPLPPHQDESDLRRRPRRRA